MKKMNISECTLEGYSLLKINIIDDTVDFKIAYKLGGEIYEKTYKKYFS